MTIQESNRMIAEWMGGEFRHDWAPDYVIFNPITFGDMTGSYSCLVSDLHFNNSWSWLMPIFQKIQTMERGRFYFDIDPWNFTLIDYKEDPEKEVFKLQFDSEDELIYRYYSAVVAFIQWYNQNKRDEP